jgi:penicillin-binding protein 1B
VGAVIDRQPGEPVRTVNKEPVVRYPAARWIALTLLVLLAGTTLTYARYAVVVAERLKTGPLGRTESIYSAPVALSPGDPLTAAELLARLRRAGYSADGRGSRGYFATRGGNVEIHPGPGSFSGGAAVEVRFERAHVAAIHKLDGASLDHYWIDPELIVNVSEHSREKRRLVSYPEIPRNLVNAIVSTEDKRFFQHSGFDFLRILKAAWVDLREGRKLQGASTITMQLARGLWLDRDKSWRRKLAETAMAIDLERRFAKSQIFESYFNQVYLGRQGSFSIHGFGEAARAYFDKDVRQLTLGEAATLAGMVQRPGYWNPFRYPERVKERRAVVLGLMRQNRLIGETQRKQADAEPLVVRRGGSEADDAPYFVDLVNNELQNRVTEDNEDRGVLDVYTTLDPELQRAAAAAVLLGMTEVDAQLRNRHGDPPQVALVAMDPHTGEVKALCGGRNYNASQLNRALAMRQPGSVFKPFVYAAALNTMLGGGNRRFTPGSTIRDEPTTFWFDGRPYSPANFKDKFSGRVTLRRALAHSLNAATVALAQQVGFEQVAVLARNAGLGDRIRGTPAVALGAYETTPLDVAGAYTIFANQGVRLRPLLIRSVHRQDGSTEFTSARESRPVLDPRIAYLMASMLEDVVRYGTAAGVRARGFTVPAAGKTGTSRDGWFAGFTSNLLCVVWVGYDDNRDLGLEGSRSALPVWTEFMKRAHQWGEYRDARPFPMPGGLVHAVVDPSTGMLAGPYCPSRVDDVYLEGSQPASVCTRHTEPELPPPPEVDVAGDAPAPAVNVTDEAKPVPAPAPAPPAPPAVEPPARADD